MSLIILTFRERELGYFVGELFIVNSFVDQGSTMKRFRPAAMGRAARILKRSSYLTIVISDDRK